MSRSFSESYAKDVSCHPVSAFGADQESLHQIRQQGRIERVKVVRQGLAMLRRAVFRHINPADHGRREAREMSDRRCAGI
ncbi:hypothetical protein [Thalassospira australica]|uniref:hypothetical protein n=1 Tax=Thalassospira australica TaxID=1528106 RepID=UPI00384D3E17